MDFFKCEAKREILVFGSGKLSIFGSCILGTFRQFCFTFPSLISETNVSFYKKVSFAAADETALQGLSCYVNTAQEHSPGDSLEFSGLEEQTGNPSSLLFVLKITPFFLKMKCEETWRGFPRLWRWLG